MNPPIHDSQEILQKCTDLLEQLDDLLGAYEPLSSHEIRRLPRLAFRRESVVAELTALCEAAGIDGGGVGSLAEMNRSFCEVRAARRVLEQLDLVRARLDARRLHAQSRMTRLVHLFYDLARYAAREDGQVRERVEPIVAQFRTRRRRKGHPE